MTRNHYHVVFLFFVHIGVGNMSHANSMESVVSRHLNAHGANGMHNKHFMNELLQWTSIEIIVVKWGNDNEIRTTMQNDFGKSRSNFSR